MNIFVNGVGREVAAGTSVDDVVRDLGETSQRGIAVALEGEVVPHGEWQATLLADGQTLEVLRAVQGG